MRACRMMAAVANSANTANTANTEHNHYPITEFAPHPLRSAVPKPCTLLRLISGDRQLSDLALRFGYGAE